jgi:hypothetical protein
MNSYRGARIISLIICTFTHARTKKGGTYAARRSDPSTGVQTIYDLIGTRRLLDALFGIASASLSFLCEAIDNTDAFCRLRLSVRHSADIDILYRVYVDTRYTIWTIFWITRISVSNGGLSLRVWDLDCAF